MKKIAGDLTNVVNRPKDVSFVVDHLIDLNKQEGTLHGRIDPHKIGVAGHSFSLHGDGSGGAKLFADMFHNARVKAAVVMSPSVRQPTEKQYASITIPLLLMTGTLDDSPR